MKELKEIAKVFLKLGVIGFGGPAAHIGLMENEVVKKRKWLSHEHFLDLVSTTNLIPGPNSTEMTMHCGYEKAGWKGLLVAGLSFILPAVIITALFAWLYQKYGQLPRIEPFIYGIKPAVIAVIVSAAYSLGRKAVKSVQVAIIGILVLMACLLGINEIYSLLAAGIIGILISLISRPPGRNGANMLFSLVLLQSGSNPIIQLSGLKIFLTFLKVGAVLYGSGYVLFGLLDDELVSKGILSHQQLIDAVAVGQFTPGPVLSAATFIGWQLKGLTGAIIATIGVFLPSFVFVLFLNPLIPKMRKSKVLSAFLDFVNIASVAIIAAVAVKMGVASLSGWRTFIILIISIAVCFSFRKLNNAFIIIGGASLGYILTLF
jgi:chromate transporter